VTDIPLTPFERPFQARLVPPGSKSLTNRALVIAALADGDSIISNVLLADDTEVMLECLKRLGYRLELDRNSRSSGRVVVHGRGGRVPKRKVSLECANSGTTIRFLAALCTLGKGTYRLDGNERMRERPIGELVDLLVSLGAEVSYEAKKGYPPIEVTASGLPGGKTRFPAAHSSQYLSAVLLAAPYAAEDVIITLEPNQTSWPYAEMTVQLMRLFGVHAIVQLEQPSRRPREIRVFRAPYRAREYTVEPDASSATYFMAAAAARSGARVTIPGLGDNSLQGDVGFGEVLEKMGATMLLEDNAVTISGPEELRGIDIDMSGMPDAAMTLAALSVFARGRTTIRGLHTLRVKETDRLSALQTELAKLGAAVTVEGDTLHVEPPREVCPAQVDTYGDHRMAMAFAVVGTRVPGITIQGAECVSKTYPGFFDDLDQLRK
jgi:3-phosphoshikimate 1-carboxyvinyltransferase